ncbi:MAG TPA: putative Ig domain-containing protein [Steroidobacteraceae bacterium]
MSERLKTTVVTLALAVLSGCGGGGDSGTAQNGGGGGSTGNSPPTIQGQPSGSVQAGDAYTFQPSASDPNGDALTFSVTNLPDWATFNEATGRVTGTPSTADIATYSNIRISVSDGQASAALSPFSIDVVDVGTGTGTATLSWTPPTENSDGSALTDLVGYQVHYGRSQSNLNQTVTLNNASLSTYMVEHLGTGTWFFALVAVNSQGTTSVLSSVASKTI